MTLRETVVEHGVPGRLFAPTEILAPMIRAAGADVPMRFVVREARIWLREGGVLTCRVTPSQWAALREVAGLHQADHSWERSRTLSRSRGGEAEGDKIQGGSKL